HGSKPGGHEKAAARGSGILPIPAPEARGRALKALIVTADDFGLSREVNEAVAAAHRNGILTAASLMVGERHCADAVAIARRLPDLRIGLHLVLVEGRPVLPASSLGELVDRTGRFRRDMVHAAV